MRVLVRGVVGATVAGVLVLGLASPVLAEPVSKPPRPKLTKAMLTFPQMKRLGLEPVSGAGASYTSDFDPSLRFTTRDGQISSFTFADSSSASDRDRRSVMMVVTFGKNPSAKVVCRIDEGSPQKPVGKNACLSERHPSGVKRPVGVSYGIKPAPGVNVVAYVSADPVSRKPAWKYPTAAQLTSAAKALAQAQVARLRAQGLIPAR